ncbi:unnamed protein product [Ranitomeya imitator]|uniref:Sodefrin-like factor n=1 Tax=Ranitomeya imitator TaxID=111125 RepID=A0ABN9L5N5_9NEOB|nr:unnamed protein product [Ranitomeya imitator]
MKMESLFGILYLILAFTAKGHCISCQLCVTSMAQTCTGVSVICPTDYVCESRFTNITIVTLPGSNATNSSSAPNGVKCKSCITVNSDWCYTSDTMSCTGDEMACIMHTTKITGVQAVVRAVRGCATRSHCLRASQSMSTSEFSTDSKYSCTDGSVSLSTGLLTPMIMFFLFIKFIL